MSKLIFSYLSTVVRNSARKSLGPLLPFVRAVRSLPARLYAQKQASKFTFIRGIFVCYLTKTFPIRPALRNEITNGGAVKLTLLAETFPHSYPNSSILYTVSSVSHVGKSAIVNTAKNKGIKIVLNQNGVAYKAWLSNGWEERNQILREIYEKADFVIFQSEFCRIGAEKFLGHCKVPSRVVFNPVDIHKFRPNPFENNDPSPILLLGGNQFSAYRFKTSAIALSHIIKHYPLSRLVVTGKLWGDSQDVSKREANIFLKEMGIDGKVDFTGQYSQEDAVTIFQKANILIHPQFNDASPTLVSEAMACGLPVVYSLSGGTPELVGKDAGIGIPVENSWENISIPNPQLMAEAVLTIWQNRIIFSEAARETAETKFSLFKFIETHNEIFSEILEQ